LFIPSSHKVAHLLPGCASSMFASAAGQHRHTGLSARQASSVRALEDDELHENHQRRSKPADERSEASIYNDLSNPIHDAVQYDPEPLAEDLYGVSITSFIRDIRKLIIREGRLGLRLSRAAVTISLLWLTIAMQVFLMVEFKRLITQAFVHKIRWSYSEYELWMYDHETTLTANGLHRGVEGHFDPERFDSLPEHISKKFICSIPLSQPYYFACILMVWSFTVVIDMRQILFHANLMLILTATVDSAKDMLEEQDNTAILHGLTLPVKSMLALFIFLPRLFIDLVLLWLGCRWLLATCSFTDVLLNAMALEFILLLKDLVYNAVVPKRNQWETTTMLIPHKRKTAASWMTYMGAFAWFLVVICWVLLYMFVLQRVLPDYKWDVHTVCENYIEEISSLTAYIDDED